jgi:hypothetical protein
MLCGTFTLEGEHVNGWADPGGHTADRQPAGSGLGAFSVCFGICLLASAAAAQVQNRSALNSTLRRPKHASSCKRSASRKHVKQRLRSVRRLHASRHRRVDERPYQYARQPRDLVKQTARDIEQNGLRWQDRVSAIDKTLNDISRCQVEILHRVSRTTP